VSQTTGIDGLEKVYSSCPCRESKNILLSSTSLKPITKSRFWLEKGHEIDACIQYIDVVLCRFFEQYERHQPTPIRFIRWPSIFQVNVSCDFQCKHPEVSLVQRMRMRL
jgi:hypothetical protein